MNPLNTKKTVVALSVLCILQRGVHAETIEVGPSCGLVDAFVSAETDSSINGCTAGSGADRIILPTSSVHSLTEPYDNNGDLTTALPELRSTITVQGNNSTISRPTDSSEFRLFRVVDSGDLSIENLSVSGGSVSQQPGGCFLIEHEANILINNSTISACRASYGGGVASLNNSTLTVTDSSISENISAIFADNSTVTLFNSAIERNDIVFDAAITVNDSVLEIQDSVITENGADSPASSGGLYGGGISSRKSSLLIINTEISHNRVSYSGGGIYAVDSDTRIFNSTISRNLCTYRRTSGGGMYIRGGSAQIVNTTISGNSVFRERLEYGASGGGISTNGADVEILNSTIFQNNGFIGSNISGSSIVLKNTIVGGINLLSSNSVMCVGTNIAGPDSIIEDGSCETNALAVDPMLVELADNGGKTMTHALLPESPAVNIGNELFCLDSNLFGRDQRGIPHEDRCDAGSFEFEFERPRSILNGQLNGALLLLLDDDDE